MKIILNHSQVPELARPAVAAFLEAHYAGSEVAWAESPDPVTVIEVASPPDEFGDIDFILASVSKIIQECEEGGA